MSAFCNPRSRLGRIAFTVAIGVAAQKSYPELRPLRAATQRRRQRRMRVVAYLVLLACHCVAMDTAFLHSAARLGNADAVHGLARSASAKPLWKCQLSVASCALRGLTSHPHAGLEARLPGTHPVPRMHPRRLACKHRVGPSRRHVVMQQQRTRTEECERSAVRLDRLVNAHPCVPF